MRRSIAELSKFAKLIYLEDVRKTIDLGDKIIALVKGSFPRMFAAKAQPGRYRRDPVHVWLLRHAEGRGADRTPISWPTSSKCYSHVPFEPDWRFFSPAADVPLLRLDWAACCCRSSPATRPSSSPRRCAVKEIPKLISDTGANVFFATDTFAQQYARNADDEDMKCIQLMVLRRRAREARRRAKSTSAASASSCWKAMARLKPRRVIAVNIPATNRHGTVGQFVPGIEWRLEPVPGIEGGQRLYVRGPNVMRGYLDPTKPFGIDLLPQGWHDTGDVVDVDQDGYIRILGRVKRFAKVGGEMVSLNAVERLRADRLAARPHAAVALPDSRKGERIILFTDHEGATTEELLAWCQDQRRAGNRGAEADRGDRRDPGARQRQDGLRRAADAWRRSGSRSRRRLSGPLALIRHSGSRFSAGRGMTACSLSRSDDLDLQQPFLIEKSADDHRDRGFARAHDLIADGAVLDRVLAV